MEKRDQRAGGYPVNTQQNQMSSAADKECMVREQDRYMPSANVIRLMRRIMPAHAKISDDAKETILECVSEFISFVTSEANMRCHQEQRKTITAEDVLWGMNSLGFDDYIEPLTFYLNRMREIESGGPLRGTDPLLRRSIEPGAMGVAPAFIPVYYVGPQSGLPGFVTMAENAGSSSPPGAGVNSLDRCSKCKQ